MKVDGINVILDIIVFKRSFVYEGFLIICKLCTWFPRWEVTAF
jgi:hypothetical protein